MVAPTTLCVPDTGKRRKEAINNQMLVPPKALKLPTIASFSVPLNELMSIIPLRTVSEKDSKCHIIATHNQLSKKNV